LEALLVFTISEPLDGDESWMRIKMEFVGMFPGTSN